MYFELTKKQRSYLEAFEWLVSNEYASGRSYLLAVAFIIKAHENPNQWIDVFDHHSYENSKLFMLELIKDILDDNEADYEISKNRSCFRIKE